MQGMHNIHGGFNVPNMTGTHTPRNSMINNVPPGGVHQQIGSFPGGRFASNNFPVALSQPSYGSYPGYSGFTNRGGTSFVGNPGFSNSPSGIGGSFPRVFPSIGHHNAGPALGVSPISGNAGPRITNSVGNMVGGGNIGWTGGLGMQGQNQFTSSVLPQGSPQVISMPGNSYPSAGGQLSQSYVQPASSLNTMGMLNDINPNDSSSFDLNDFPQLTSHPSSAGGPQGQLGSLRNQGLGVSPVQQNQEFSIQNEDFPALPGFKDYAKEQPHDNAVPMMQSQHFSMGRSAGFSLGGTYSSHHPQPQQHNPSVSSGSVSFSSVNNQNLLHQHGSDIFPSSNSSYHSQTREPPGIGLRPLNSPNTVPGVGSYNQLSQQYQQQQNQPQFHLQMPFLNQSFRDHDMKFMQPAQFKPDPYGLLGLINVIHRGDPLALGLDLTQLGFDLNSSENLHETFKSPWAEGPANDDPKFNVPQCYYAEQPPALRKLYYTKFSVETLFYIFYSMPKDTAQLYAADELYERGWSYHKERCFWFIRSPNKELLVKTHTHERGTYHYFDSSSFEIREENFVVRYEMVEKRPHLTQ
ncbi:probable NOT transcription complex subunit VIP2 isoform X2 [Cicer arietinum]|uniref:Probable NOT transcription complex subunit VIP2 isoform X1 n=1 Tax=Cicer arietinum TaxID=3827 RepID=A0A1S3EAA2_CICAR|nr:probable NOT transcription complex subunit VIP2 isoform X1 [Cicer arietinum]